VTGVRGADVFRPNAKAYQPGRNSAEHGKLFQETQRQWELLYGVFMAQGRPNEVLVREELGRLGDFCRKLTALLNGSTQFV
jgi:hypothetical protein